MAKRLKLRYCVENLIKSLIQSLSEKHFDIVCDLWIEELNFERALLPLPEIDTDCISPEWDEIEIIVLPYPKNCSSEATQAFLKTCQEKRNTEIRVKRKKGSKSILSVLEQYNVKIRSKMILCPFHLERTPSCRIYPETDTFYCFGCGKYGTAEDLEQALRGEK